MPNLPAAKKALRVSQRKAVRNSKVRARVARITKKTLKLIELGETKLAEQQMQNAYKALDKAAKNRVIHPKKSARIKSRLQKKLNEAAQDVKPSKKTS